MLDQPNAARFATTRELEFVPGGAARPWGLARRLAFRFGFVYVLLYCLPSPIEVVPGGEWVGEQWQKPWFAFVPWFAKHVLRMQREITDFPAGSGDTTFN